MLSGQDLNFILHDLLMVEGVEVAADTVLEFVSSSFKAGEIHGIGFEEGRQLSDDRVLLLDGPPTKTTQRALSLQHNAV